MKYAGSSKYFLNHMIIRQSRNYPKAYDAISKKISERHFPMMKRQCVKLMGEITLSLWIKKKSWENNRELHQHTSSGGGSVGIIPILKVCDLNCLIWVSLSSDGFEYGLASELDISLDEISLVRSFWSTLERVPKPDEGNAAFWELDGMFEEPKDELNALEEFANPDEPNGTFWAFVEKPEGGRVEDDWAALLSKLNLKLLFAKLDPKALSSSSLKLKLLALDVDLGWWSSRRKLKLPVVAAIVFVCSGL